ncbi:hypothetical protein AOLI_G00057830 [Acnodon oligacanthus]
MVGGADRGHRRSISEVQLMHTVGIHKHEQQRQQWLQVKMLELHTAPRSASGDRRPLPEHSDALTLHPKRWTGEKPRACQLLTPQLQ